MYNYFLLTVDICAPINSIAVSDVTAISEMQNAEALQLPYILSAPVISSEKILLTVSQFPHPIEFIVYDVAGRMVKNLYRGEVVRTITLKVKSGDFPSGFLFFKVTGENVSEVRKLVKVN